MTVGTVSVTDMLITSLNHNVSHNDHLPHHRPHPAAAAAAHDDDDDDVCISLIQLHDGDAQFFVRIIHSAKDIVLVLVQLEAQVVEMPAKSYHVNSYPSNLSPAQITQHLAVTTTVHNRADVNDLHPVLVLVLEAQVPDRLKSYPCKFVLKRVNSVTSAVIQPLFVITSECDEDHDN